MSTVPLRYRYAWLLFFVVFAIKEGRALETKDWGQAWLEGQTGFHRDDVNPLLVDYWPTLAADEGESVLVPLSGKTVDMIWLARQHRNVYWSELVEQAVALFFADNTLQPVTTQTDTHVWWKAENITIIQGDFFMIPAGSLVDVTAFYDRAALVALPSERQPDYVATMMAMAPALKHGLLITLDYAPELAGGPPYAVSPDTVGSLYGQWFDIKLLGSAPPERIPSRMAGADVSSLVEHAFWLTRKACAC